MPLTRRGFLIGTAAVIAAPALVSRANVMAVRPLVRGPSFAQSWSARMAEAFNRHTVFGENAEREHIEAFRQALIKGEVGTIDNFRIVIDPADKSDHAAIARYERRGGHVLVREVRIIEAENWKLWH